MMVDKHEIQTFKVMVVVIVIVVVVVIDVWSQQVHIPYYFWQVLSAHYILECQSQ